MYTAIYYLAKVAPVTAYRLANYFFPICPWEAEHDLANAGWAEADVFNAAQDDLDDLGFDPDDWDSGCMACLEPDRYDDHLCMDEWLV